MSEVTYKKIVDVEQIDTLGEGTTLFVNDNGSMKQMGAAALGAVKSVNGVLPDENGNVEDKHLHYIRFLDGSAMVPGMIQCAEYSAVQIRDAFGDAYERPIVIERLVMSASGTTRSVYCQNYTIERDDDGYIYHLNFGDEYADIILNTVLNTITLDPDWVAPEADPEPTGAHQMLVTGADGSKKWEDRTHWAESSSKIVYDGTVNPAGASYGSVYLQVPNGMDIISLEAQSYTLQFCGHRWDNLAPFMYDEHVAIGSEIADETIPFVFVNDNGGDGTTTALMMISQDWVSENLSESDLENPRLIIIEHSNEIKKLDHKYFPDGYPYTDEKTMPIGTTEITADKLADNNLSMDSEALGALSAYNQAMIDAGFNSYDHKFYAICNGKKYLLTFDSVGGSGSTAQWTYSCKTADDLSPFTGIAFISVAGFPPIVVPAMPNDATDEDYEAAMARLPLTIEIQGVLPDEVHPLDPKYLPPLVDANGGKWRLVVSTDGKLSTEAVTE